jgi:hypothetical protein
MTPWPQLYRRLEGTPFFDNTSMFAEGAREGKRGTRCRRRQQRARVVKLAGKQTSPYCRIVSTTVNESVVRNNTPNSVYRA